jgi:hypothetical protein
MNSGLTNFSSFLRQRATNKPCASARQRFESLGGSSTLRVSLRQYQHLEGNRQPPSASVLVELFKQVTGTEKKDLIISFFNSYFEHQDTDVSPIAEYLKQYLHPQMDSNSETIWGRGRNTVMYSDEQLLFLTENAAALRLHSQLFLLGEVPRADVSLTEAQLLKMQELSLVEIRNESIFPTHETYRIPTYENSNSRSVSYGTNLILRKLDLLAAREGNPGQRLFCTTMNVKKHMVESIFNQLESLLSWIQTLAINDASSETTPLFFLTFGKRLTKMDFK